jgi:gag-polypeptide of LTR copia-type
MQGISPQTQWDDDEVALKQLIASSLPDMIFSHIKHKPTMKVVWDELKKSYKGRSTMVRVDKHWELSSVRCGEKDNV